MGAVEQAVDAAANFIGPFVDVSAKQTTRDGGEQNLDNAMLVREAIGHLQAINTADLAADPDAPYDASLAGVVYGLLDLTVTLGVLPYLSSGVAFSQRPRSVLIASFSISSEQNRELLQETITSLLSILEQREGTGLQPLLAQRSLPDIIAALADLAFSPQHDERTHCKVEPLFDSLLGRTATSRLLPVLTTFLQQPLPPWLKPRLGRELATVPVREHGVRHVIEFLSLSYLSKNSQVPKDASGPQSRIPIPLEAVTQASKLLISPPAGRSQDDWIQALTPQLLSLLDGKEGRELSRAAGQVIAGGILNKRSTGAPGTVGWKTFAEPIMETLNPRREATAVKRESTRDSVIVQDQDLLLAVRRLAVITTSYSHAGLIKRIVGPLLLPLWALLNYARSKRTLDKAWTELPRTIITKYVAIACDPRQFDTIATNLFWDGPSFWILGPGTKGGVEIRTRQTESGDGFGDMESMFSRISELNGRIDLLTSLLADGKVPDDAVGQIFLQTTKRWLSPNKEVKKTLLLESDDDPLTALTDAKLSEVLASRFKESFAKSPEHIIALMTQLLQNYVSDHRAKSEFESKSQTPSRYNLGSIVKPKQEHGDDKSADDTSEDDLASFAISIINTLISIPEFTRTSSTNSLLSQATEHLQYLIRASHQPPVSPVILNSARNLLEALNPAALSTNQQSSNIDPLASHRTNLQAALQDLTSPEAPNRTWSLHALHKLIENPLSFPVIDVPAIAHMVLSASLADPESYVHSAAIPVLVSLALRAPHPTIKILVDAFLDVDERSLALLKGRMTDEKERELQESLDYRLRVGEVVNKVLDSDSFWAERSGRSEKYTAIKHISSACLSLASRRGQRNKTHASRAAVSLQIVQQQQEAEAAWGGPIPNILEPDTDTSAADQADFEALSKIVKGWEDTGVEEDVRIRASALSLLGTVLEKRLGYVTQNTVDAGLQIVLLVLTMETGPALFILRRAAVLVVMGLLRALDAALDAGVEDSSGLGPKQQQEVERVLRWARDEDGDELVRDHAAAVIDGIETLRMRKLFRLHNASASLTPDLGLEVSGGLRGLSVTPAPASANKKKLVVEEIE